MSQSGDENIPPALSLPPAAAPPPTPAPSVVPAAIPATLSPLLLPAEAEALPIPRTPHPPRITPSIPTELTQHSQITDCSMADTQHSMDVLPGDSQSTDYSLESFEDKMEAAYRDGEDQFSLAPPPASARCRENRGEKQPRRSSPSPPRHRGAAGESECTQRTTRGRSELLQREHDLRVERQKEVTEEADRRTEVLRLRQDTIQAVHKLAKSSTTKEHSLHLTLLERDDSDDSLMSYPSRENPGMYLDDTGQATEIRVRVTSSVNPLPGYGEHSDEVTRRLPERRRHYEDKERMLRSTHVSDSHLQQHSNEEQRRRRAELVIEVVQLLSSAENCSDLPLEVRKWVTAIMQELCQTAMRKRIELRRLLAETTGLKTLMWKTVDAAHDFHLRVNRNEKAWVRLGKEDHDRLERSRAKAAGHAVTINLGDQHTILPSMRAQADHQWPKHQSTQQQVWRVHTRGADRTPPSQHPSQSTCTCQSLDSLTHT
jgi:hypothetical protein